MSLCLPDPARLCYLLSHESAPSCRSQRAGAGAGRKAISYHSTGDVLFGDVNPVGRLPQTVYASDGKVPSRDQYDVSQGFTYMFLRGGPLFPFGHGLSYTEFKYANLCLATERMSAAGVLVGNVDVSNAGQRSGDEVVQLYVCKCGSRVKARSRGTAGVPAAHAETTRAANRDVHRARRKDRVLGRSNTCVCHRA